MALSKTHKKKQSEDIDKIIKDLHNEEMKAHSNLDEITRLTSALKEKQDQALQTIMFRARVKFIEHNEKCTKFFFRRIQANHKASNITLLTENGRQTLDKDINATIHNHYKTIYDKQTHKRADMDYRTSPESPTMTV